MTLHSLSFRRSVGIGIAVSFAGLLAACDESGSGAGARAFRPIPSETLALMDQKGTSKSAPILIRAYKKEAELEIWKQKPDGRYTLLKTFPMCRWSGQLGPKTREGDRQVPEGFYTITPGQMNPNSNYYLSFNVGYPNAYDRAYGHTGGSIMVHGACSSAGCFSMTDEQIGEIYAIAREAFSGGQRSAQMQSLPFRMTADNLTKHRADPHIAFWRELKKGADHFEVTKQEPQVGACGRHYVFNASPIDASAHLEASAPCPALKTDQSIETEVAAKERRDDAEVADLIAKGVKAVRVVYQDGGQHPDFFSRVNDVSRPEALGRAPIEVAIGEDAPKAGASEALSAKARIAARPAAIASSTGPAARGPVETANQAPAIATGPMGKAAAPGSLATASASVPESAFAPQESHTPLLRKWWSIWPDAPAAPTVPTVEPATPQPADVPLPPPRQAAAPLPKPQALNHHPKGMAVASMTGLRQTGTETPKQVAGGVVSLTSGFEALAPADRRGNPGPE